MIQLRQPSLYDIKPFNDLLVDVQEIFFCLRVSRLAYSIWYHLRVKEGRVLLLSSEALELGLDPVEAVLDLIVLGLLVLLQLLDLGLDRDQEVFFLVLLGVLPEYYVVGEVFLVS